MRREEVREQQRRDAEGQKHRGKEYWIESIQGTWGVGGGGELRDVCVRQYDAGAGLDVGREDDWSGTCEIATKWYWIKRLKAWQL
jgi:hypothetical protein